MVKRTLVTLIFMFSLVGCAAYEYGYDSASYEGKLVNLESDWGQKRLNQITGFDTTAMNLISLGYSPAYLYEVTDDNYYFISESASYHLERPLLDTDSNIKKIETLPLFILSEFERYGISLPASKLEGSATRTVIHTPKSQKTPRNIISELALQTQKSKILSASELFELRNKAVIKLVAAKFSSNGDVDVNSIATGSGVMITEKLLVTNYHVIEGRDVYVSLSSSISGDDANWYLYKFDKALDLALMTTDANHNFVDSFQKISQLKVGQKVYAIGSPKGLKNTLSEGLISGKRIDDGESVIQTTASITFGSSGGGLFSDTGELIGITSSGLDGGANLNFAIPMDSVFKVYKQ